MTDDGEAGKRDGMARVDAAANEEWKRVADMSIIAVSESRPRFISDHVWAWLAEHYPNAHTHNKKALGPRMTEAAKAGVCERIYKTAKTARRSRHATDVNVWQSLHPRWAHLKTKSRKPFDPNQFDLFTAAL